MHNRLRAGRTRQMRIPRWRSRVDEDRSRMARAFLFEGCTAENALAVSPRMEQDKRACGANTASPRRIASAMIVRASPAASSQGMQCVGRRDCGVGGRAEEMGRSAGDLARGSLNQRPGACGRGVADPAPSEAVDQTSRTVCCYRDPATSAGSIPRNIDPGAAFGQPRVEQGATGEDAAGPPKLSAGCPDAAERTSQHRFSCVDRRQIASQTNRSAA
jgi:hypothetical protein